MASCADSPVPLEYQDNGDFFGGEPPLGQGIGYAIVIGFGVFFSIFTSLIVYLEKKYTSRDTRFSSEEFNTAGRSIKMGLTASNIVSQWTWAATLLQSSNVAWSYGVSGPFWYAAGASIQVLLFGILAIELKRKAPRAHTFLEIVLARWGYTAHKVFLWFGLLTNVIVTSMLLLGGAAVTNALTGMNLELACFLIPWGVILYTMSGGLKAAFVAAYTHVVALMAILCLFMFLIYAGPTKYIGSAGAMYKKLDMISNLDNCSYGSECQFELTACGHVSGNYDGSYLTMVSKDGLVFGIINVVGNFGTVFLDQVYWQSAIAAKPQSSHKGYMIGGMCWFCIPFSLATSLGLAAVAMALPLSKDEANAGLVPPATAYHILGDAGAALILIILFMAVTGAGAHEMIGVSSIVTYDVYKTYFNPQATGQDILRVSHRVVAVYGLLAGLLAVILNEIGLSLGWVYLFMGIAIGSGVIPIAMCLTWEKATANGAIIGAITGQICGFIAWLIAAKVEFDEVTVDTLGENYPMLSGNLAAILVGGFVCGVISLMNPQNFDWEATKNIAMVEQELEWFNSDYEEHKLAEAKAWILRWGSLGAFVLIILWPAASMPLGVFAEGYFKWWVSLSLIWGLCASAFLIFWPIGESWEACMEVLYGICGSKYVSTTAKIQELSDRITKLEGGEVTKASAGDPPVKSAVVA